MDNFNKSEIFFEDTVHKFNEDELKFLIKEALNEMLSSFPNQYTIAKTCADNIYDMLDNNQFERKISFSNDIIKKINLKIVHLLINGQIVGFDSSNKELYIEIGLNLLNKTQYYDLINTIAHEIMYGDIFIERNNKKQKTDDMPEYYSKLFTVMDRYYNKISYYFAHALYATYYQETNALVSQIYTSLDKLIPSNIVITKDDFVNYLKQTNSYLEFNTILTKTIPTIENMSNISIQHFIIEPFKDCGIDIDLKFIKQQCNIIKKKSRIALKKCYKNTTLYINKLSKEDRIKI